MPKNWRAAVGALQLGPNAAETASTNGAEKTSALLLNWKGSGLLVAIVGPVTGTTPTLNLKLQGRALSTDTFVDLAVFPQITAAGLYVISVPLFMRRMRYVSTIGGTTPSFTYGVGALALDAQDRPDAGAVITT